MCSSLFSSIFSGIYCNHTNFLIKNYELHKTDTMHTTSPSSEIFEKEHIDKKEYLKNELKSLGIETKRKNHLNDNEELQNLSDNIKQAMFQDYKIAYSEKGDVHKEEAESTVTVG
jgi:hypothetical protein